MSRFTTLLALLAIVTGLRSVQAATYEVKVGDNYSNSYSPSTLTVRVGDVVKFTWISGDHPTMSDSQPAAWAMFESNNLNTSTTIVFNQPGSFPYHCMHHASLLSNGTYIGMTGVITVQGALGITPAQGLAPVFNIFPNPANKQTTVQVSGPAGGAYQLCLSNVLGREVRRLAVHPATQPKDGVTFDLSNLPAGLYFCSLLVDDKVVATKRLTVF